MHIEDILRAHGLGTGQGTEIVTSETQPTVGLKEGLFWYQPSAKQIKMYVGGVFTSLGGGSISLKNIPNSVTLSASSKTVAHGIGTYNPSLDVLLVFQNTVHIQPDVDYTVSTDGVTLTKANDESWAAGTRMDFLVIQTLSSPKEDAFTLGALEKVFVVTTDGTRTIPIGIPEYNNTSDYLTVFHNSAKLYKGRHFSIGTSSINLEGFAANAGDEFLFVVMQKVRDTAPDYMTLLDSVTGKKYKWGVADGLAYLEEV